MKIDVESRRRAHDGFLKLDVLKLRHEQFDGSMSDTIEREIVSRPDAVSALLYNPDTERLIFVEQVRPAISDWTLETPAGLLDHPGEDPQTAMIREIVEETGYFVTDLHLICEFYESPAVLSNKNILFYAEVFEKPNAGGGLESEGEDIQVVEMTAEEAYREVDTGEICTPAAIIAIQWFRINKDRNYD